jgi:hypothetical protein
VSSGPTVILDVLPSIGAREVPGAVSVAFSPDSQTLALAGNGNSAW